MPGNSSTMAVILVAAKPSSIYLVFPSRFSPKFHKIKYEPQKSRLHLQRKTSISISSNLPSLINRLNTPSSLNSLDPIIPFLQSEWKSILRGWLCSFVSVACLSGVVPKIASVSRVLPTMNRGRLMKEGCVVVILILVRAAMHFWQQAFLWEAALNAGYKIRVYVFERVLQRDLVFFEGSDGISCGDVAYRITAEAADIADTMYALLNTIVPNTLQLFAMATQMLVASPFLSLISTLVIPCMCFIVAYLGEKLRKISRNAHYSVAKLSSYLNEVLPYMLSVKVNNAEVCESARFERLARDDLDEHLKKKLMKALIPQIIQVIYVGAFLIFCAGSLAVSRGSFDGSSMVSFITSLVLLIEPIQGVGKAYNELKEGEPAIERLFDLTRFHSQVIEKPDAIDLDSIIGDVKFSGVTFQYGEDMPLVLNGLNLHIKAGETVALVGPSGGGKTTLMKLLLRLYDPLCGVILVDDHDIQNIKLQSLRHHVALVPQNIALFPGTVAENIGYRDLMRKINMEQVEHAARIANAEEFIKMLPDGYQTNIGPRGSLLSGGQQQRLAIARTIYQNSSILILDEATSALDSRSELLVRQAVERLMDNHTVLIIAHRLETISMADRVLLLDGGRLEEVTHSSLMAQGGRYGSLVSNGIVI